MEGSHVAGQVGVRQVGVKWSEEVCGGVDWDKTGMDWVDVWKGSWGEVGRLGRGRLGWHV